MIVLFLFFALSAVAVSCVFFTLSVSKPYIGIWLAVGDQGWTVHSVDDNGLANRAGIREGEGPVEVNGQPAEVFLEKYTKSDLTVGRVIRDITVIDDHGQLKSVNLNHSSPIWRAVIEVTNWFIVCLIFWIIGFYVVFRKPNNAAALLLCLCGLTLGLALSGNMAGERGIPTASFLEVVGSVMFPWLLLHFFLVLPEERAWVDEVVALGYIDTFRHLHPDVTEAYTWWSMPTRARARNVGWRIDYFFVAGEMLDRVVDAFIAPDVMGSDHCPVGLRLQV